MTRKKFIKHIMARGFDKRKANRIANMVWQMESYKNGYYWLNQGVFDIFK